MISSGSGVMFMRLLETHPEERACETCQGRFLAHMLNWLFFSQHIFVHFPFIS